MSGGKATAFETALLELIFNGTTITGLAQNVTSGAYTNLYVALHTADPGVGGDQTTHEAAYPGYAREAVVRTSGGWTVSGNSVSPAAAINFPAATGSPSETETWASVGVASSGASMILYRGPLAASIVVNAAGIIPQITTATALTES